MKIFRNAVAQLAALGVLMAMFVPAGVMPAHAQQVDLEAIFTCDDQDTLPADECNAGRVLVMDNCTACHAFVQIVLRQYDEGGWTSLLNRHRERVRHLADDDVTTIRKYLAAKFNPERDPPELPQAIIEALTDY